MCTEGTSWHLRSVHFLGDSSHSAVDSVTVYTHVYTPGQSAVYMSQDPHVLVPHFEFRILTTRTIV